MHTRILGLAVLTALSVACAHGAGFKNEPLIVQSVAPSFGEDGQGHLELVLEMDNAGGSAGLIHTMNCDVFLNQRWFASASGLVNLPLVPNGKILIPVHIPWALRRAAITTNPDEGVDVEVRGRIDFDRNRGPEQLTFGKKLRMQLDNVPRTGDDPL